MTRRAIAAAVMSAFIVGLAIGVMSLNAEARATQVRKEERLRAEVERTALEARMIRQCQDIIMRRDAPKP